MNFDRWEKKYQPIQNHFNKNAGLAGIMFETYGDEVDFVKATAKTNPNLVWTWIDCEEGKHYLVAGWHFVNRIGYVITKEPWSDSMASVYVGG